MKTMNTPTITYLEWWNGTKWTPAGGPFQNARIAWMSLGADNLNYRTIGHKGVVEYENRLARQPDQRQGEGV